MMAADGDDPTVQLLGQSPLLLGQASFNVPPAPDGRDRSLLPRLRTNALTQTLPYAELESPVVITVQGALSPVYHDISASAFSFASWGICPGNGDDSDQENNNPPVEFAGSVGTSATASSSWQDTSAQSSSDVTSSYVEGDNVVISMNLGFNSSANIAGDSGCQPTADTGSSSQANRIFTVSAPMTYQVEATCSASAQGNDSDATGAVYIHVDGSGLLYSYTCNQTGAVGSPSGNGILFPGAEVQLESTVGGGSDVFNQSGAGSASAAVSVTLTLSPQ